MNVYFWLTGSAAKHAYALDLKNQYIAANTNKHVSQLAEATNHDTTAVKWLTYLSLAYLPASFVAVSEPFLHLMTEFRILMRSSDFVWDESFLVQPTETQSDHREKLLALLCHMASSDLFDGDQLSAAESLS